MDERDSSQRDAPAGISLDELPDATQGAQLAPRRVLRRAKGVDPRAQGLEGLSHEQKLLAMTRWYEFDRKEPLFGRLILALVPTALKYGGFFPFLKQLLAQRGDLNIISAMSFTMVENLEFVFQYSELLSAGLIFLFPPLGSTRLRFLLGFEGLDMPRQLRVKGVPNVERVRIKWEQIAKVVPFQGPTEGLEIQGHSKNPLGQLRWDLRQRDKLVVLKLLRRFTAEDHPLRRHVERELANEE